MKKLLQKKNTLAAAVLMSVMCASSVGFAAEVDDADKVKTGFALDEYVVTANRIPQRIQDVNADVMVINSEDLERHSVQNIEEALRMLPGLEMLNYGLRSYQINSVRLNGTKSIVVLVDGVRINNMGGVGQGNNFDGAQLDQLRNIDNIERIEVLRGAAGVMYGSDAKGGVINIITKDVNATKTKISIAGGTYNTKQYKINTEFKKDKLGIRFGAEKFQQGDTRDAEGLTWPGSVDDKSYNIRANYEFSEGNEMIVSYNKANNEFTDVYDYIYDQNMNGEVEDTNLQISLKTDFSDNLKNTLSYGQRKYDHDIDVIYPNKNPGFVEKWGTHYKQTVISDELTKVFGDDKHILVGGFEYIKNEDTQKNADLEIESKSFYLQDTWNITDKWNLTGGVRITGAEGLKNKIDTKTFKSASLGYRFDDKNNLYTSYHEYFILPNASILADEKYGNKDLKPEEGENIEIGYSHTFNDNAMIKATYFKREATNTVGWSAGSGVYQNFDESVTGWDINASFRAGKAWNFNLGFAQTDYDKDALDYTMIYLPKYTATVGVTYEMDRWNVGLTGRAFIDRHKAGNDYYDNVKAFPSDSYWVWNIGAHYRMSDNLKIFARCNNLFNKLYAEHSHVMFDEQIPGTWYSMPGRNFMIGCEYNF